MDKLNTEIATIKEHMGGQDKTIANHAKCIKGQDEKIADMDRRQLQRELEEREWRQRMERKRDEQTKLIQDKIREIEAYNAAHNITTSQTQNTGSSNNNTSTVPKTYAEKAKDKADRKENDKKEFNEAMKKLKKISKPPRWL